MSQLRIQHILAVTKCKSYTNTHTHTHNHFMALRILSGTTWVSRYQKKHSPTHTYRGNQSSLICFLHLLWSMASSLFNLCAWVFFHNLSPSFLWSASWLRTLHFIFHTFLYPIIVFLCSTCPYHCNMFCCSTEIMSFNPSVSDERREWVGS